MPAGHFFRIVSVDGPQVGDLNLWAAKDLSERFYSGKTRALHGTHLSTGDRVWSSFPHWMRIPMTHGGDRWRTYDHPSQHRRAVSLLIAKAEDPVRPGDYLARLPMQSVFQKMRRDRRLLGGTVDLPRRRLQHGAFQRYGGLLPAERRGSSPRSQSADRLGAPLTVSLFAQPWGVTDQRRFSNPIGGRLQVLLFAFWISVGTIRPNKKPGKWLDPFSRLLYRGDSAFIHG